MFFLLYKRADDAVFDDFPKISDHFPTIPEDFRNFKSAVVYFPVKHPCLYNKMGYLKTLQN